MKSIRKIITAAAAAAVIATVGATTALAALPPTDGVDVKYPSTYIELDYGAGYSKVINTSTFTRYCEAYVETQNRDTFAPISGGSAFKYGNCAPNNSLTAQVGSDYLSTDYRYYCSGSMRGGATPSAPIIDSIVKYYYPN